MNQSYCNDGNCEKNRQGEKHAAHFGSGRATLLKLRHSPKRITVNQINGTVYLACKGWILVIDGNTDTVISSVMCNTKYVGLNHKTNRAYAVLEEGIAVIETSTNKISRYLFMEQTFSQLCVDINKNLIYATNISSESVFVIDGSSDSLISQIKVSKKPIGIAFNSKQNKIFVTHEKSSVIFVIDCHTNSTEHIDIPVPITSINNSAEPYVSYDNNMLYVLVRSYLLDGNGGAHELDSLYVIDTISSNLVNVRNPRLDMRSQTILKNDGHESFAVNYASGDIYLTSTSKKSLVIMNSQGEVKDNGPIKKSCIDIAINSVNNKLYLAYSSLFKKELEIKYLS